MKITSYYQTVAILFFSAALVLGLTNCSKKEDKVVGEANCEVVVNPNGPGFLKVINESGSKVEVYMGNFIPFGAEIRDGRCEIYGLPDKTRDVEFTRLNDDKLVVKSVSIVADETVTIMLNSAFFN